MGDLLPYDPDDEIPDEDYFDDLEDDWKSEEDDEGEDTQFLDLDDEFDTKDDEIESKRWNKKPKKDWEEDE